MTTKYNVPEFFFEEMKEFNKNISSFVEKNKGGLLWDFAKVFSPKKTENEKCWFRISSGGEFSWGDSAICIVSIKIITHILKKDSFRYSILFSVDFTETRSWTAVSELFHTEEEAKHALDIAAPILDDLTVLPTAEVLNKKLLQYGIYGIFN